MLDKRVEQLAQCAKSGTDLRALGKYHERRNTRRVSGSIGFHSCQTILKDSWESFPALVSG